MSTSKKLWDRKSRISKYATSFLRLTDKQIDTAERHGDYGVLERLTTTIETNKLKERIK